MQPYPLPRCRTLPSPQKEGPPHQQSPLLAPPQPMVTSDYRLPVVDLFWMFPVNGIIHVVLHCIWLLSRSRVFSGFASSFCTACIIVYVGVFTQKASVSLGVPSVTHCALPVGPGPWRQAAFRDIRAQRGVYPVRTVWNFLFSF